MTTTRILALLLVAGLPFAVGCQKQQTASSEQTEPATQTSEKEIPGTNQPNDLTPVQAQTMVDDVTLGHVAENDGTIAAQNQGDEFAPGDSVVVAMKVADAPAGTQVKVAWYGPKDVKLGENEKGINPGATFLVFENPNTKEWKKGGYRAEVWVGDEKVAQETFNVVERTATGG